jgi:hypothetical protein
VNIEIEAFRREIKKTQIEIATLRSYLGCLTKTLDYFEWLQGILTLCRTGK